MQFTGGSLTRTGHAHNQFSGPRCCATPRRHTDEARLRILDLPGRRIRPISPTQLGRVDAGAGVYSNQPFPEFDVVTTSVASSLIEPFSAVLEAVHGVGLPTRLQ